MSPHLRGDPAADGPVAVMQAEAQRPRPALQLGDQLVGEGFVQMRVRQERVVSVDVETTF